MEAIELKPCPNPECRSVSARLLWLKATGGENRFAVVCDRCETRGASATSYVRGFDMDRLKAEAARLWNLLPRAEPIANSQRRREEAVEVHG